MAALAHRARRGWCSRDVQWLSVAALAAALVAVGRADVKYDVTRPMSFPYMYSAIYLLLLVQAGLIVLLFISTAVSKFWPAPPPVAQADVPDATLKGFRPTLWGFTAFFIATIAWLAGGGSSAGVGLLLAQFLGNPVSSSERAQCETQIVDDLMAGKANLPTVCDGLSHSKWPSHVGLEEQVHATSADAALIIPPAYIWAAIVFFGLLLVLLFIVVPVVWVKVLRPRTTAALKEVPKDYDLPPTEYSALNSRSPGRSCGPRFSRTSSRRSIRLERATPSVSAIVFTGYLRAAASATATSVFLPAPDRALP